ncbi:hypothetical protein LCGC14_0547210 [marine sediment metagenome]|uniref:Uncharacterized protein n=1 Tax=marine sediment metagenome TaxID=412755 RepID=A0A0F9RVR2_9ZZZZ
MIIIFNKLSQEDAQLLYTQINEWFKDNPKRRKCHTDLFNIRRGHVKEDILERSEDGVNIVEKK